MLVTHLLGYEIGEMLLYASLWEVHPEGVASIYRIEQHHAIIQSFPGNLSIHWFS